MAVDDLDIGWPSIRPDEANPPLIVDADAVLTLPVASQPLQPIRGRRPKIADDLRLIEQAQLTRRDALSVRRRPAALPPQRPSSRLLAQSTFQVQ